MDIFTSLFDLLGALARRRYQAAERGYATIRLNHTEARLLRLLEEAGGATAQDLLSARLQVDRSNASRAMKQLESRGYIERVKDSEDQRRYIARLTAAGSAVVREIARLRRRIVKDFFGSLTEEEAVLALSLLQKVVASEQN